MTNSAETILVVDDNPANLGWLCEVLELAGYTVHVAVNGPAALQSVAASPPDLILLDIQMPGMNGLEVCRRLKADPAFADIPVIFLTALSGSSDEVEGLEAGAADYITKPIRVNVVLTRVKTQLTLRRLQHTLQERNAALDAYAQMVAHDLKNPLAAILSTSQYMITARERLEPDDISAYLGLIERAGLRAISIIQDLLLLARTSSTEQVNTPIDMSDVIVRVRDQVALQLKAYNGQITMPELWPTALGNAGLIELVWANLISNGLKYGGRPPLVELGATPQEDGMVRFWVRDNGDGLTPEAQQQVFEERRRLHAGQAEGHGLGLVAVKRIIEQLGGMVGVESSPGAGSTFFFTLPAET